ncbi:MAG: hypothetical protein ACLU9S_01815 [Oscillospiraceae bacterium]
MKKEFPFLTAEDDALLQKNPDSRGIAPAPPSMSRLLSEAGDYAAMKEAAWPAYRRKEFDARDSTTVAQNYLYISGYQPGAHR